MKDIVTYDEHLDQRYGKVGTEKRTEFEIKAKSFAIGEIIREARKEAQIPRSSLSHHPEEIILFAERNRDL